MSKPELDFSDISSKPTTVEKPAEEVQPKLSGVTLTIPVDGKFLFKDLADCSAEEFIAWASGVHLPSELPNADELKTPTARLRVFKQIYNYHTTALFPIKDGLKKEKMMH